MLALADFWGKALGRPVRPGAIAGDTAVDATGPECGPEMILHNPPESRTAGSAESKFRAAKLKRTVVMIAFSSFFSAGPSSMWKALQRVSGILSGKSQEGRRL